MKTWMVRSGKGGRFAERYRSKGFVSLGWSGLGDITKVTDRAKLVEKVQSAYPDYSPQQAAMAAGQMFRFLQEVSTGDRIVTYDSGARTYHCGINKGAASFDEEAEDDALLYKRPVDWEHEISRDDLSSPARNSLGSIATFFAISLDVSSELWRESKGSAAILEIGNEDEPSIDSLSYDDLALISAQRIADVITRLSGAQMEELVSGLLRAMGYKTQVSAVGSDRGADIVASPDGLGLQEPRIVVEVKHRPQSRMGAPEVRAFVGGRHTRDRCLYVSTGGFTTEAKYEADRSTVPVTLMDFDLLVDKIVGQYSSFDEESRQLIPLKPVYWTL